MGSQRVGHDLVTEQQQLSPSNCEVPWRQACLFRCVHDHIPKPHNHAIGLGSEGLRRGPCSEGSRSWFNALCHHCEAPNSFWTINLLSSLALSKASFLAGAGCRSLPGAQWALGEHLWNERMNEWSLLWFSSMPDLLLWPLQPPPCASLPPAFWRHVYWWKWTGRGVSPGLGSQEKITYRAEKTQLLQQLSIPPTAARSLHLM